MHTFPFGGLWAFPTLYDLPGQHDYAFIDESRGRLVQFMIRSPMSLKRSLMLVWYRPQSETSIVTCVRKDQPWREYVFHYDGETLSWMLGETIQIWRRVPPEERPDWLDERLAEAHAKMDAMEQSGDAPER